VICVYAIAEGHDGPIPFYSEVPQRPEPSAEALLAYERVLETLMEEHTLLPMRFGSVLAGEDELEELLTARRDEFSVSLARVRGRVELGIRARLPAETSKPESGRAYLAAKLATRRSAADLHAELAPLAADSTYRVTSDPEPGFAGSYLVDRDRLDAFRRAFDAMRAERPQLGLTCTGPWPPYSFTRAEETP
jgi:hypothetical protein